MENKSIIVVCFFIFTIQKAELLNSSNGKGVCSDGSYREKCCYGYIERDSFCIQCPVGTYGGNCAFVCPSNMYGQDCSKTCNCTDKEICHPVNGCLKKSIYMGVDLTSTTVVESISSALSLSNEGVAQPCLKEDAEFKITYSDMITYGALFALIVLVVINIVISKTHVMEVKHEIYPIIEDCYGSIVSKPKISGKKLARESKRQIAKQLSAMIDKSRSREADYQNVELAGGFMNNLNIEPKAKQTVMDDFQSIAHDYIPDNVMDNKEYFSIDEV